MSLFDTESDPLGGPDVVPSPELDATQEQTPLPPPAPISVPDVSPLVAAMPGHTPIPPAQPIPNPANDPHQRLLALFTSGLAAGLGPHSGVGAGLGYHVAQQEKEMHDAAMRQWQVNENERQRQIQSITQQNAELDRTRSEKLRQSLEAFSKGPALADTKEEYDRAADAYGNGLAANGFRISPNWIRQNIPWTPPTMDAKLQKAVDKWKATNGDLLHRMPQVALASPIMLKDDKGQPYPITLGKALEKLGELPATVNGQVVMLPKEMTGNTAFVSGYNNAMNKWLHNHVGQTPDDAAMASFTDAGRMAATEKQPPNPLDEQKKRLEIQKLQNEIAQGQAPTSSDLFELTPDKPTVETGNKIDPRTGLTPNAIYQAAMSYALEGKMPSLGLGSRAQVLAARNAVQNKAGAIAQAAGVSLPDVRSQYAANRGTVGKLLPQYVATESAANAASDNLDLAEQQSANVARTGSKLVNRYAQWAQGNLTPAKGLTQFEVYVYTAAREYAKVASGGALSAQGLTDSAAREAEKLLNAAQSPDAFSGAVEAMKNDMANVLKERQKSLGGVSSTIASFLSGAPVAPTTPTAPPTTPRVYYDSNGQPIAAPKKP